MPEWIAENDTGRPRCVMEPAEAFAERDSLHRDPRYSVEVPPAACRHV